MGTTYTVRVVAPPAGIDAHRLRTLIEEELRHVDAAMSAYRPDSEVSRFNANASTDWFAVSPELAHVVAAALEVSEASGGAFDVTIAPLVSGWGFGPNAEADMPAVEDAARARAREHVGFDKLAVRLDPPALRKVDPALAIDLNGIAPGYAVDRIASQLEAAGAERYLIDIGGEIRVRGTNVAGRPWRVAVERPAAGAPRAYAALELREGAVATSGDYRQYVEREGVRASHTIDPRTGRPIPHTFNSVVVLHAQAMYADAWATAFNVLGAEAGRELAAQRGMAVLFIANAGETLVSSMTPAFEQTSGFRLLD